MKLLTAGVCVTGEGENAIFASKEILNDSLSIKLIQIKNDKARTRKILIIKCWCFDYLQPCSVPFCLTDFVLLHWSCIT